MVSSAAGLGSYNGGGKSTTVVNAGASVAGTIVLGGADMLSFNGSADFSGVMPFDGGDAADLADTFIDVLTFNGPGGSIGQI